MMPFSVFALGAVPDDGELRWGITSRLVRDLLHKQAPVIPFDHGFMECDFVDNVARTERKVKAGEQVDNFQSVYASCMQSGATHSTGRVRCDDASPSTGPHFLCKQKTRKPLGAHSVRGIMLLLSNTARSMAIKTGGFVFRTESIIERGDYSELSA
jgi:hypothetical protein